MRLATVRRDGRLHAARVEGDEFVLLDAPDAPAVLRALAAGQPVATTGVSIPSAQADLAPVSPHPAKIFCVGLNYRSHLAELGFPEPEYPTLFAKFAASLLGARDDLVVPRVTSQLDWEVELTIVVGQRIYRADEVTAAAGIGGYTVGNDITMRDWQRRTKEWLQGKAMDASTPIGPVLVTPDEIGDARDLEISCEVDGVVQQLGRTRELVFPPAMLLSYISQFAALDVGDLVLTGTPGGVGAASGRRLTPGHVVRSVIEGIGECVNRTVPDPD